MDEFSNSHKSREAVTVADPAEKKLEKVTAGEVTKKKRSGVKRFSDAIISDDIHKVGTFVLQDVLLPTLKKGLYDIIVNSARAAFGMEAADAGRSPASGVTYRSYDKDYERSRRDAPRTRRTYEYDDIFCKTQRDAESLLDRLYETCQRYGSVSVADYYELAGEKGTWTDNKYGWYDLRDAYVAGTRDGWTIRLPRATALN